MSSRLDAHIVVSRDGFTVDAELHVDPGQVAALLGPNGAGKSTIVAALAGLVRLDAGQVILGHRRFDVPETGDFIHPEERRVGVVFQDLLLFDHMTVYDNIAFGLVGGNVSSSKTSERVTSWADRMGLSSKLRQRARELSGGEAQKVALARALIIEPHLLLLDEPLAALDTTARVDMRRELTDHLADYVGPTLFITHDPAEAFLLSDEVYILETGSITQSGSAEDIRMGPRSRYVADLAGVNLFSGTASSGVVDLGDRDLAVADSEMDGAVLVTIHPHSISLHRSEPKGSQRNVWQTSIERVEHHGDRVRVLTGIPLALTVEVTPAATEAMSLEPGMPIWVAIKATEVGVLPG